MITRLTSFGLTPGAERAVDPDQHVLGRRLDQRLGGEDMLDLRGADAEGERAHGAMRRGVAVAADDRHPRLRQTLLRPDHMDDALVEAGDRKIGDAEFLDVAFQGLDLQQRIGFVDPRHARAAVGGRDVVVGDREGLVGTADAAAGELQPFKGLRRRHLMDQVKIDVDQVGACALRGDDMGIPDLVEQRAWLRHRTTPTKSRLGPNHDSASAWWRVLSRDRSEMRAALPVRPRR